MVVFLLTYLLALNACSNVEPVDELLQDGSERSDTNPTTNQHRHFVSEPILVTLSKWTVEVDLGEGLASQVGRVVVLPEVVGPGANGSDVQAEQILVGGRADGEGMELAGILGSTGDLYPLAS